MELLFWHNVRVALFYGIEPKRRAVLFMLFNATRVEQGNAIIQNCILLAEMKGYLVTFYSSLV